MPGSKEGKRLKPHGENRLSGRIWFNICLFGFAGQIAWNLENMYFNTFLYNTVYEGGAVTGSLSSMTAIRLMVAFSAVAAVLTTFVMGNLSDRVNRRKIFISVGYIIWGAVTASFALITKENVGNLFGITDAATVINATAITVIVMDCIMTFFGSTSNDSVFNAWVTDITTTKNRATVESVLAIMPIAAMLIVIVFGGTIDVIGGYPVFFCAIGGFVMVCGIVGLFTLQDSRDGVRKKNNNYWHDLVYGFRPSVVKQNYKLYLAFAAMCVFQTAVQVFFPYLLIYLQHSLGFDIENLFSYLTTPVLIAAPFVIAALIALIVGIGKLIDRIGKNKMLFVGIALFIIGLVAAGFVHSIGPFLITAIPLFAGYGLLSIMLNATARDYTPEDKAGMFQGVRMIFYVLIPMVVGPTLGDWVCKMQATGTYIGDDGTINYEPCAEMFIAAGILSLLILIPTIILRKKGIDKTDKTDEIEENNIK